LHEVKKRVDFSMLCNAKVQSLKDSEYELRKSMEAVRGKRIVLFEEMLKHYGYPDLGVVDELKHGAALTDSRVKFPRLTCCLSFTPALLTRLRSQAADS
jgi:hypothetical protein